MSYKKMKSDKEIIYKADEFGKQVSYLNSLLSLPHFVDYLNTYKLWPLSWRPQCGGLAFFRNVSDHFHHDIETEYCITTFNWMGLFSFYHRTHTKVKNQYEKNLQESKDRFTQEVVGHSEANPALACEEQKAVSLSGARLMDDFNREF